MPTFFMKLCTSSVCPLLQINKRPAQQQAFFYWTFTHLSATISPLINTSYPYGNVRIQRNPRTKNHSLGRRTV